MRKIEYKETLLGPPTEIDNDVQTNACDNSHFCEKMEKNLLRLPNFYSPSERHHIWYMRRESFEMNKI